MEHQRDTDDGSQHSGTSDSVDIQLPAGQDENIHIRNFDHQWGYDVEVTVLTADGETAFTSRYYVQPGQTVTEFDRLPSGAYHLKVTLDNDRQKRVQCRIDSVPAHTAVIEVGNGVFALTEGLRM